MGFGDGEKGRSPPPGSLPYSFLSEAGDLSVQCSLDRASHSRPQMTLFGTQGEFWSSLKAHAH